MVKKLIFIFSFLCSISLAPAQDCYQLVWSDEFDGNGVPNSAIWDYDLGNSGFGNNEIQNYTNSSENVRIENGILIIEARKNESGWTSARMKSQGKKSFTYGRIEFRAKLPAGSGTWPALWLLGESISSAGWPACGEIDVMEHVGKDPGKIHASIHTPSSYGATQNTGITTVPDFSTAFHNYVLDWTENKMDFYIDDQLYYTYSPPTLNDNTWPFAKPCFLIMNIAMGGNWGSDARYETGGLKNGIDPSLSSVRMEVDYVRYYSKTEKPKISGNSTINKEETAEFSVPLTGAISYTWKVPPDARITTGQNTNHITVKWGVLSGDVSLDINTSCGTISTDPFPVKIKTTPTTSIYPVPNLNSTNSIIWEAVTTAGNTLTLSSNPDLEISYNINAPQNNPYLNYSFDELMDFSNYKYLSLTFKTEKNNPPSVVRLDLIDINGNNNQDNILKITNFENDESFHTYANPVISTSIFQLSSVKALKLYIDYGIYSGGAGKVWLKEVALYKDNPLSVLPVTSSGDHFVVFPNPATSELYIEPYQEISCAKIISAEGQVITSGVLNSNYLNISGLHPGLYNLQITDKTKHTHSVKFVKN